MIYVLSASTLMALIFLPTLGAKIGFRPKKSNNSNVAALSGGEGDPMQTTGFIGLYVRLIAKIIHYPILVLAGMGILAFSIIAIFGAKMSGPPPKPNRIEDINGIESVYTVSGAGAAGSGGISGPTNVPSDTVVRVYTELMPS